MNYAEAVTKLGNRSSRKLANNTYLQRRDDETIALRFHATDVLLFTPKWVEYQSGGWFTVTTKDRMSRFGNATIGSDKGRWLIYLQSSADCYCVKEGNAGLSFGRSEKRVTEDCDGFGYWPENPPCYGCGGSLKRETPDYESGGFFYFDGIRVSNDGRKILKPTQPREISDNSAIKKDINAFVSSAIAALRESLPMPSGGDCWFCAMKDKDGKTLGDLGSTDHLIEHMREGYIVPSLLWNAVREAGYRFPEIILGAHDLETGSNAPQHYRLGGTVTNDYGTRDRAMSDSVARALRRYLKRRLVPNEIA